MRRSADFYPGSGAAGTREACLLTKTDTTEPTLAAVVQDWLARFEDALAGSDEAQLSGLFHAESYWRDLVALTWGIGTVSGADAIAES